MLSSMSPRKRYRKVANPKSFVDIPHLNLSDYSLSALLVYFIQGNSLEVIKRRHKSRLEAKQSFASSSHPNPSEAKLGKSHVTNTFE